MSIATNDKQSQSLERWNRWREKNSVVKVQFTINPLSEPELYEAYLKVVESSKGKKEALAKAILCQAKNIERDEDEK